MLTTNSSVSRVLADDGKRRIITTSSMKPAKAQELPREWPGVNKVEQKHPEKTFYQASELQDLMRKKKASEAKAAKAERIVSPAVTPVVVPKPTVKRKATRKKG